MNKNKICKIAGIAVASAAIIAGGAFYGIHQLGMTGNSSSGGSPVMQSMVAQNVSTTESQHVVTLHFKWEGSQPHVAYSVDETNTSTTNPGVPMNDEGNGWYTYTIKDAEVANMAISVPELDYTTSEFSRSEGEYWYDMDTGWYTSAPSNYEEPKTEIAKTAESEEEITEDVADVAADSQITVHYKSDWDSVYLYAWNALPNDIEMEWPGENIQKDADGYYTYTFQSVEKVNFLFSGASDQTEDYSIKGAGEYWYHDGEWVTKEPIGGSTSSPKPTNNPDVTSGPDATTKPEATPSISTGGSDDFREETIYFLITTRFYDGDSSNNVYTAGDYKAGNDKNNDPSWRGDFKGLIEKLDYIKALGFTAIWITPVVQNNSEYDYHGYHAYNFSKIDSRYESDGVKYQDLVNAVHSKGMKIIQDVVLNHTCSHGEENLKVLNGATPEERQKIIMDGTGDDPNNPIFHHNGWTGSGGYDDYTRQKSTMDGECFDLETENPTVYNYLIDCYKKMMDTGIDGFRIDTVAHISRLTFNQTFLPAFKEHAKELNNEDFFMYGEVCTKGHDVWYRTHPGISTCFYTWAETEKWADKWTNSTAENEVLVEEHFNAADKDLNEGRTSQNAFLNGNEYHTPDYSESSGMAQIDFQVHYSFDTASNAFEMAKKQDEYFNDATWNVVYVDSHDYGPDAAGYNQRYPKGTDAWAENLCLMFTFRGIPCIYYGSEIEFQAGQTIDIGTNGPLASTGRAYYGDHLEGTVTATDYGTYTASGTVEKTLSQPLSQQLIRLNKIRRAIPALQKGQYSMEDVSGNMAYKRRYTADGEDSFVCVAVTDGATFNKLPGGTYIDVVSGDRQEVSEGGTLTVNAPGKGNVRVYVLQNSTAEKYGANGKIGSDTTYLK